MKKLLLFLSFITVATGFAEAATIHVSTSGSDATGTGASSAPFATIQKAVDASQNGDVVLVAPGTYLGEGNRAINLRGKKTVLRSAVGPIATILDLGGFQGILASSTETTETVIDGFSFRNGYASTGQDWGGVGIIDVSESAALTLRNLIFTNNTVEITYFTARANIVSASSTQGSVMENCLFYGNSCFGGYWSQRSFANVVYGNFSIFRHITVANNVLKSNSWWTWSDGGLAIWLWSGATTGANSVIVRGNGNRDGYCMMSEAVPVRSLTDGTVVNNAIQQLPTGYIEGDPLFKDASSGDFSYLPNSPAKDAGDPTVTDADGSPSDIGFSLARAVASSEGNLLVNGSFENSAYMPGNTNTLDPSVDAWSGSGNFQVVVNGLNYEGAHQGQKSLVFNAGERAPSGSIEQTVAVLPSETYFLSFWLMHHGADSNTRPGTVGIKAEVLQNGEVIEESSIYLDTAAGYNIGQWYPFLLQATSAASTMTVRFTDISTSGALRKDIGLDSVSLRSLSQLQEQDSDNDGLTDAWELGYGRYQIVEGNFTWQQAKADAESKGGHLGTFTTAQEWDFFKTLPQLQPYRDPSSALARQIWTGGFEVLEGTWKLKWVTGETWSFSNFAPPEPSAPDTSAIAIHPFPTHPVWGTSGNVYWNDDYDHRQQPYILEFGYPTDPFKADADGDDFNDKVESDAASDPNDAASVPKFADSDNDGVTNYRETQDGTDPNNPTSFNPLSKGLVAYYPFDKGLTDETGYGKDLDQLGDHEFVADLTKNSGQALRSPSRVNGGVMSSKESGVSGNSPRTISFWFRSDGPQPWPAGNVVLLGSRVAIDRGRGNIQIDNGYRNVETPSLEFLHQRVNHFVWTYQNKLGDSRFYVNGQPVELVFEDGFGDPETTLEGVPDGPIKIMGGPQAIGFGDRGFQGEVDNARLYDRTLTEAEVQQLYATEAGDLDSDGDGLTDAWERGFGRFSVVWGSFDLLAAQQDAAARGGKLASFSTMAEWYAASSSLPENLFAWIGATDSGSEGAWRWFDGTDWAFSNWGVGEPNNQDGIEHYAQIWGNFFPGQKNAWNDVHSGVTSSYVIEYGFPTDPFKSDSDADGLKDGVETGTGVFLSASNTGTNPLDSDTSGDGILDGEAVLWNFNPLTDHTQVLAFLRHATGVQSGRFGLYTESSVMDLNLGGVMLQKTGTQASVRFKVLSKMDLRDPAWTDRGTYLLPPIDMPGSKGFLRIRAEQP